ncbi:Gfo/Idh/MocA family oxidoreductase [Alienimonas californiensis]|uniref:Glucose--fructose oxidoreductase n=1 Tax=Alienimonas californiensis TaxID=2527989 RepID=A0A517P557_9PLAN|nr:Gfo/Idh/MocA family oxidoreductase [Alienimonas californiensis]QDT14501.1 Glucose--fructose oxidoreductase precursor [Alienimonas californiensis]
MSAPATPPADRRDFLKTAGAVAAIAGTASFAQANVRQDSEKKEPVIGHIGTGSRWNGPGMQAAGRGKNKILCDVDRGHLEAAAKKIKDSHGDDPELTDDYRKVIDDPEIDVVVIVTPDHWHTKPLIEAVRAGKDVYCEKPLTLTIQEGIDICKAVEETGRTVQVGTQQRTEMGRKFLTAVALVREGRLGDVKKITCGIGGSPTSGDIPAVDPPQELNWEKWLGQTPEVAFRKDGGKTNCHYEFRWWYEYSGGKMTDWGAHHVDIAQWALDQNGEGQGPTKIVPNMAKVVHPAGMDENGMPVEDDKYNAASKFEVSAFFPGDVEMVISSDERNGLLIEGTKGRIFVSRGDLTGAPVDELKDNPLPEGALERAYKGQPVAKSHMDNFFAARDGKAEPISDVFSHHRALTTCHLANIAIRLGRELNWDPKAQKIVGDEQAQSMTARTKRDGYDYEV